MVDESDKRGLSERLRRVRRKPGSDQLSAQGDGTSITSARRIGHTRSQTWIDTSITASNDGDRSILESIQRPDLESAETRKPNLWEQRALWEASLPKPLKVCVSDHTPDHIRHSDIPDQPLGS
jgi:serine/threonine-protein phosphatase PP1 catalytic subunit